MCRVFCQQVIWRALRAVSPKCLQLAPLAQMIGGARRLAMPVEKSAEYALRFVGSKSGVQPAQKSSDRATNGSTGMREKLSKMI